MNKGARTRGGGRWLANARAWVPPPVRMALTFVGLFWVVLLGWEPLVRVVDAQLHAGDVITPLARALHIWMAEGAIAAWLRPGAVTGLTWSLMAVWVTLLWSQARTVMLPEAADRAAWWGGVAGLWLLTLDLAPLAGLVFGTAAMAWARRGSVVGATLAAALAAPWVPGGAWFALVLAGSADLRRVGVHAVLLPSVVTATVLALLAWGAGTPLGEAGQRALLGHPEGVSNAAAIVRFVVAHPGPVAAPLLLLLLLWLPGWLRTCAPGPARGLVLLAAPLLVLGGAPSTALAFLLVSGVHASGLSHLAERAPVVRRATWFGLLVVYALLSRLWMGG